MQNQYKLSHFFDDLFNEDSRIYKSFAKAASYTAISAIAAVVLTYFINH